MKEFYKFMSNGLSRYINEASVSHVHKYLKNQGQIFQHKLKTLKQLSNQKQQTTTINSKQQQTSTKNKQ